MVVATLLHPSRETASTIVASESRLVAAHVVYTVAWLLVLLGLPGLYAAQRGGMGRLGLVGFLTAFTGTYLIAVTGNFGFLAPVLAKCSPAVLDSINQYSPVVIITGWRQSFHDRLRAVRHRHDQSCDAPSLVLCPSSCGRSRSFTWFRDSTACHYRRLADRDCGSGCLGAGLGWAGLSALAGTETLGRGCFR
jgi:hypothetical protein